MAVRLPLVFNISKNFIRLAMPNFVVSRDQNAEQSHSLKMGSKFFESVEQFKYLVTTLTNRNSIHDEIKSIFRPGNP